VQPTQVVRRELPLHDNIRNRTAFGRTVPQQSEFSAVGVQNATADRSKSANSPLPQSDRFFRRWVGQARFERSPTCETHGVTSMTCSTLLSAASTKRSPRALPYVAINFRMFGTIRAIHRGRQTQWIRIRLRKRHNMRWHLELNVGRHEESDLF
jgi:hypothetical protein